MCLCTQLLPLAWRSMTAHNPPPLQGLYLGWHGNCDTAPSPGERTRKRGWTSGGGRVKLFCWLSGQTLHLDVMGKIWHFCFVIYKMHQESNKMPHSSTSQQDEQRIDCTDDQYLWLNSFLASCWGFWWKCESWGGSEWVQGRVRERERWRGYIGERGEGGEV